MKEEAAHHVDGSSIELSPLACHHDAADSSETCDLIESRSDESTHSIAICTSDECTSRQLQPDTYSHCRRLLYLAIALAAASSSIHLLANNNKNRPHHPPNRNGHFVPTHREKTQPKTYPAFPAEALLGVSDDVQSIGAPYDPFSDFQYGRNNRTLLYWEEVVEAIEQYKRSNGDNNVTEEDSNGTAAAEVWSNLTTWGACYPRALPGKRRLGTHSQTINNNNWTSIVQHYNNNQYSTLFYPTYKKDYFHNEDTSTLLGGHCRPSFLIIGQGKCGTSSLYHYLTGHPRVLPAKEKQIHYFLYHTHQSLKWYYSHFPSIESYLGSGGLMSGEASPGYMPYPSVLERVVKKLSPNNVDHDGLTSLKDYKLQVKALPKIISIVREPIDRAISSYKYNYITPALERMRSGTALSADGSAILGGQRDVYYMKKHMFRLEELVVAELKVLRDCLEDGGFGERYTVNRYGRRDSFFYESIQERRNSSSLPNLIHLDGACYRESSSLTVPRVQWKELGRRHPEKILALPDLQLVQSIIGRGLYAFPLEWWYEVFGGDADEDLESRIEVVCTEDMANVPVETMENVTRFLGLPEFDSWENVTGAGRYNVGSIGGHRGYDSVSKVGEEKEGEGGELPTTSTEKTMEYLTSMSDSLMTELMEFYKTYNERLFELIGKRCPWYY
jgi:hypothetical protein